MCIFLNVSSLGICHYPIPFKSSSACIFIPRLIHLNKIDHHAPNEMLYGRMGYVYALLFVNKNFGVEKIPQSHIQQVPHFCAFWSLVRIPVVIYVNFGFVSPVSIPQVEGKCQLASEGQVGSESGQCHAECCWKHLGSSKSGKSSPLCWSVEALQKMRARFHLPGAGVSFRS